MTNFLKNYSILIVFVLSFILDAQYQILEKFITDPFWLNIAKGFGALVLAYLTNNKLKTALTDIGGGNIPPEKDEK